ncbi:hypothetical protein Q4601_02700 [Shewanella sp. 1_MG-2023]|uniref:hypothetical protein n=1 Tax=unclassified Shewanella TaxID=196818 RepID=UPI0026E18D8D|nr:MULTISPECIES: hypothetical protein [unclassified Shewanella]MDO6610658.1 hypothetical protein [Shewanella sp. 7_MG-2023]MDO6770783.1 hypothetical protein [Shewanella sp. 2_MG-2023]MDO6793199.1 hypothetical protein [Shewanella sp. 1_MG-2023]
MKLMVWDELEPKYQIKRKQELVSQILLLAIIAVIIFGSFYAFHLGLETFYSQVSQYTYIKKNTIFFLPIVLVPFWGYLLLAVLQYVLKFSFKHSIFLANKCGISGLIFGAISILPVDMAYEKNLESEGYSYCYWYTGPSFRAPDVWLKNETLCLQSGSLIRSDIEEFFEDYNIEGTEPTLAELEMFIAEAKQAREDYIGGL